MTEFPDGLAERSDAREGAVVGRSVFRDAADGQNPRCDLVRHLHERIDLLPLVLDVEARLPLLNQLHLVDERGELVWDVLPRHV